MGLGKSILGIASKQEISLEEKQAAAAVGNPRLMAFYSDVFGQHENDVGQVLMTPQNTKEPRRRHNIRQTILKMLEKSIVPIIKENDTVTTYSIRYGDNDSLASLVAKTISADLVILLTDIKGYYQDFNSNNPSFLSLSTRVLPKHFEGEKGSVSDVGTGGMLTKIKAAKIATEEAGCHLVIASGRDAKGVNSDGKIVRDFEKDFGNIRALFSGKLPNTLFTSQSNPFDVRNLQIMSEGSCSRGAIVINGGSKKGLFPNHVVRVVDEADRGEVVKILVLERNSLRLIGWGILAHKLDDIKKIKGLETKKQVKAALGYAGRFEVMKREDIILREPYHWSNLTEMSPEVLNMYS